MNFQKVLFHCYFHCLTHSATLNDNIAIFLQVCLWGFAERNRRCGFEESCILYRNCVQSWILFHLVHICKKLTQHCKAWWMHAYLQYLIPTWAMWQMALANFVRSTPHCVTLASSWQSPELIFVATIKTVQVFWNIQACLICLQDMWNWFFCSNVKSEDPGPCPAKHLFFGHFFVSIIF